MRKDFQELDNELAIEDKTLLILSYAIFCYWQAAQVVLTASQCVKNYQSMMKSQGADSSIDSFLFLEEDFYLDLKLFEDSGYGVPTEKEVQLVVRSVLTSYYDALE